MKAKRQRHVAAYKAKVGLEALVGVKTVAEIAKEYQVHPTQVSQWKRAIVDRLPGVFEHGARRKPRPPNVKWPDSWMKIRMLISRMK